MNWKLTLTLEDNTEDVLYFATRDEARIKKRFYASNSASEDYTIGLKVIGSTIEKV